MTEGIAEPVGAPVGEPAIPVGGAPEVTPAVEAPAPDWRDGIDDEYSTHGSMANFKSKNDLAKAYINAQKLVALEKIPVPVDDDPATWDLVADKLGRPSDPSLYELGLPEGAPEHWKSDKFTAFTNEFANAAHKAGLNKKQAQAVWQQIQETNVNVFNEQSQAQKRELDGLAERAKKEFGANLPQAIKKRDAILKQFGGEEVLNFVKNNPTLDRSPALLKMFSEIAKNFSNDTIPNEEKLSEVLTPREAQSKINAIRADKNHPYNSKDKTIRQKAYQEIIMPLYAAAKAGG